MTKKKTIKFENGQINLQPINSIQHFMMMFYLLKANLNIKLYVAKDMALKIHEYQQLMDITSKQLLTIAIVSEVLKPFSKIKNQMAFTQKTFLMLLKSHIKPCMLQYVHLFYFTLSLVQTRCYKNIKIVTNKKYKSKGLVRALSLFNTGLTLFKRAINSRIYIRIPMKFILYDI